MRYGEIPVSEIPTPEWTAHSHRWLVVGYPTDSHVRLRVLGHIMKAEEFYGTAKIYDTSALRKSVDVSPFGDRQSESCELLSE